MKDRTLLLALVLFFSLIFVSFVFASLYAVRDQEGKIVAITDQNVFKFEFWSLGYTFELLFEETERTPTLDNLIEDWVGDRENKTEEESRINGPEGEVKIVDFTSYLSNTGSYYYVDGVLKNIGKGTAKFIKVKILAKDKYKKLVSLEETYADPVDLKPGDEATFSVMVSYNPKISGFEVRVSWVNE